MAQQSSGELARDRGRHVGRLPKLAPDQLDNARRLIVAGESRAQVARSLGVDPSTLRRLLPPAPLFQSGPRRVRCVS